MWDELDMNLLTALTAQLKNSIGEDTIVIKVSGKISTISSLNFNQAYMH